MLQDFEHCVSLLLLPDLFPSASCYIIYLHETRWFTLSGCLVRPQTSNSWDGRLLLLQYLTFTVTLSALILTSITNVQWITESRYFGINEYSTKFWYDVASSARSNLDNTDPDSEMNICPWVWFINTWGWQKTMWWAKIKYLIAEKLISGATLSYHAWKNSAALILGLLGVCTSQTIFKDIYY